MFTDAIVVVVVVYKFCPSRHTSFRSKNTSKMVPSLHHFIYILNKSLYTVYNLFKNLLKIS